MSGMVEVRGENLRRLRVAGVKARRGLGGVLDGWWVPGWCKDLLMLAPSAHPIELGWVFEWVAGSLDREDLEAVADWLGGAHREKLDAIQGAYMLGGWSAVVALTGRG